MNSTEASSIAATFTFGQFAPSERLILFVSGAWTGAHCGSSLGDRAITKTLLRLDTAVRKGIDPALLELIKIRASQLNHCAFCLDMHTQDALAAGESIRRIVQLSAWEESAHFYSPRDSPRSNSPTPSPS